MTYICDMCGVNVDYEKTEKLLSKRYCKDCILIAKSTRRKLIRRSSKVVKHTDALLLKRIKEGTSNSLESIINKLKIIGFVPILNTNIPIRLKRNEKVYLLAGRTISDVMSIALAVTNQRLFFTKTEYLLRIYLIEKQNMTITRGIKAIALSSIIAIDTPKHSLDYKQWESIIHLDRGKGFSIIFSSSRGARIFYAILTEMVDRINDPIDNSVFSPKRERIPDEVKIAVWRRDGGVCAHCGSREKLEYDHIIPVSKGGSNSQRNIELLCEKCNRKKSNKII